MSLAHSYLIAAISIFGMYFLALLLTSLWRFRAKQKAIPSKGSFALISLALILIVGTFISLQGLLSLRGDALFNLLALGIFLIGLLAGALLCVLNKRVAVFESLYLVTALSFLPIFQPSFLADLMGFQTATIYFALMLLMGAGILSLGLILGNCFAYLLYGDGKFQPSFSYEAFIAKRFLMAKRGVRVVSLITVISVCAVAVATAGMIIVMSVMNGFTTDFRAKIMGTNAHLIVLKYGNDFSNYPFIMKRLEKIPEIRGKSPFVLNEVMISSQDNLSGAVIKGIDVKSIGDVTTLPATLIEGSLEALEHPIQVKPAYHNDKKPSKEGPYVAPLDKITQETAGQQEDEKEQDAILPGIVIGQEMARALRVFVGDVLNVVSPLGELGPTGPIPKSKAFRVVGIFYSGMYEYDAKFSYIALSEAQLFFNLAKSITGIECRVANFDNTPSVARDVQRELGGYPYYTKDWMQMNNSIFSALRLEKIAMFIILVTLIFMASLLILVTLIIVVIEKGKEIAILKSMGATDVSIMKIFVGYGLSVGLLGTSCGLFLGLSLCLLVQKLGIGLDPQVYYISSLPIKVDLIEISLVVLSALVVSFLATVPPALFAAKLRPVDGLRYE